MFEKFTGDYEKRFYDIKLKTGEILKNCWPNAGNFHSWEGKRILGEDVVEIKKVPHPFSC